MKVLKLGNDNVFIFVNKEGRKEKRKGRKKKGGRKNEEKR